MSINVQHIKGHVDHPWNEMADVTANVARSGTYRNVPEHDIPEPLRSCYTTQQWMWYFAMNKEQKEEMGLPQSQGNTMMLTSPPWDWNPGTLKIDQDPMTHEQNRVSAHQKAIEIDFKIATYNVQSLAKPDKATQISKQCKKNGYHIIGIQESGNTKAGQPSDLNYWRMATGPQGGKKGRRRNMDPQVFPNRNNTGRGESQNHGTSHQRIDGASKMDDSSNKEPSVKNRCNVNSRTSTSKRMPPKHPGGSQALERNRKTHRAKNQQQTNNNPHGSQHQTRQADVPCSRESGTKRSQPGQYSTAQHATTTQPFRGQHLPAHAPRQVPFVGKQPRPLQ